MACAKLPFGCPAGSLVNPSEQCKKNARQKVLLGQRGTIIDNSGGADNQGA
jgi:hypothetical protein